MNKFFTKMSAIAFLAMLNGNAMATDYYLSSTGVDTNDGTSSTQAVATLSKALGLLKSSDDILHVSGLVKVAELVNVSNKDFTINIEGTTAANDGFDGDNQETKGILSFSGVKFVLKNLSVVNGKATEHGVLYLSNVNGTIENCIFKNNEGLSNNNNQAGGAIFANSAKRQDAGLVIKNSQFFNNSATASGGAASIFNLPTTIENCTFSGNQASYDGGALNFSSLSYSITNCCFVNNNAVSIDNNSGKGGAIKVYMRTYETSAQNTISYSTFYGNTAKKMGSCYNIDVNDTKALRTLIFDHCTMSGNTTSTKNGGAINIYGPQGDFRVTNSILEGNVSDDSYVDLCNSNSNASKVTISNSVVGSISGYSAETYPSTDSYINKTVKLTDTKYAGLGDFTESYIPLLSGSLANKMSIGAAPTATVEPTDGMMYVSSLKADGSVNEVTICRHLKGGQWNTLCLPFNLNNANEEVNKPNRTEFATYFGEGAKIACLSGGKVEDGVVTFSDRSTYKNSDIVAARAYIVRPTEDKVVKLTKAVTNTNLNSQVATVNGSYKFVGVLNSTDLSTVNANGGQVVCLGGDGKFFVPGSEDATIGGLRGYFIFPASVDAFSFKVGGYDTTGITGVTVDGLDGNAKVYSLGGQYLGTDTKNLPQGVYVVGNKKVVVK